ncbi:D,D-heptose 1,7-bisphosphate phosphatase [Luminiphilus syltensis NOR5-1B]|uniref:D,D-heptose 1,7-bisphosphate phosphatase n=1 Tax=Luminiphilus syltensis NOR5-1B TaxID=565045 RepID=B8KQP4_9GAMM|nr:D-glycero-beta-D-manno-heptose 1,7-bisphosphate 7-phosphatase [Luminiphilus syltensis]EED36354.1 D,D-heptose 1,7-bisphosphate phosphatase [Luminiphilus syltensis NOR5-1B]
MARSGKAAFIDRDGVINRDHGYVYQWQDFEFLPGAIEGMRRLQEHGCRIIVITNQSGIGRGFYDEAVFEALTDTMCQHLQEQGVRIDRVYFCPHHPEKALGDFRVACDCRKPAPGMLLRGIDEFDIDPGASLLIGDKPSDIEAGIRASIGHLYQVTEATPVAPATAVASLLDAADRFIGAS